MTGLVVRLSNTKRDAKGFAEVVRALSGCSYNIYDQGSVVTFSLLKIEQYPEVMKLIGEYGITGFYAGDVAYPVTSWGTPEDGVGVQWVNGVYTP